MKAIKKVILLAIFVNMAGCSQYLTRRDYLTEMEHDDSSFYNPTQDFPVMSGDTGKTWETKEDRRRRTPASAQDIQKERSNHLLSQELRQLEGQQSEGAYEFYEQHKDQLTTTSEKIYFLQLPFRERKEYLASRGIIAPERTKFSYREESYAQRQSSIILGMSKRDVINNFGKPARVEVAGNPSFENERWVYVVNGASKYIYFESGQVGGWE